MAAASKCTSLSAAAWTQGLLQLLSGNHLAHFATLLLFLPCSHHTFETSCPALCHTYSVGAVALAAAQPLDHTAARHLPLLALLGRLRGVPPPSMGCTRIESWVRAAPPPPCCCCPLSPSTNTIRHLKLCVKKEKNIEGGRFLTKDPPTSLL